MKCEIYLATLVRERDFHLPYAEPTAGYEPLYCFSPFAVHIELLFRELLNQVAELWKNQLFHRQSNGIL